MTPKIDYNKQEILFKQYSGRVAWGQNNVWISEISALSSKMSS